jgi:predicted aconitase with swiveling domain
MKKNNLILVIVIVVVVGGLAFWGGVQYQKRQIGNFRSDQPANIRGQLKEMPERSGTQLGRAVNGEIISVEDETITIKTQEDDTRIVIFSDLTRINKTNEGSIADLQIGEQVMVVGAEDTSGVVTAQNISIGEGLFRQISPPSGDN